MASPLGPSPSLWPSFGHSYSCISYIVAPKTAHKDLRWGYTRTDWIRKITSLDQQGLHHMAESTLLVVMSHCWLSRMGLNVRRNKIWIVKTRKFIRVVVYGGWNITEPSGTQLLKNGGFEIFPFYCCRIFFCCLRQNRKPLNMLIENHYLITLTWWFSRKIR